MGVREKLMSLRRRRQPVEFTRPLEPGRVDGYVLAVGPKLFLTARLDDAIRLDGFEVFRIADVRGLQGYDHAALVAGEQPKRVPADGE